MSSFIHGKVKAVIYMVIETDTQGLASVHTRVFVRSRMLPPGVAYRESWIEERGLHRCFRLLER